MFQSDYLNVLQSNFIYHSFFNELLLFFYVEILVSHILVEYHFSLQEQNINLFVSNFSYPNYLKSYWLFLYHAQTQILQLTLTHTNTQIPRHTHTHTFTSLVNGGCSSARAISTNHPSVNYKIGRRRKLIHEQTENLINNVCDV